jgi:hypothetical protein
MNKRVEKAKRIVAVQRQMHRIEDWRMIELKREAELLDASRRDTIQALSEEETLRGEMAALAVRRLRYLVREAGRVGEQEKVQAAKLLDQTGKLRRAERLEGEVRRDAERESGRKQLVDIIEGFLSRKE